MRRDKKTFVIAVAGVPGQARCGRARKRSRQLEIQSADSIYADDEIGLPVPFPPGKGWRAMTASFSNFVAANRPVRSCASAVVRCEILARGFLLADMIKAEGPLAAGAWLLRPRFGVAPMVNIP